MTRPAGSPRLCLLICLLLGFVFAVSPLHAQTRKTSARKSSVKTARKSSANTDSDSDTSSKTGATKKNATRTRRSAPATAKKASPESGFDAWVESISSAERNLGESWSVVIEDLATTATIFEYNSNQKLTPASNRKIITFGMVLETLGPDYQFQTEFGLSAPSDPGHPHYHGDVILRASGDPSMTDPFLKSGKNPAEIFRTWAKTLKSTGINSITGNIIIDASAFGDDQNIYPQAWDNSNRNQTYAPIPSALTLCQNLMSVSVSPGSDAGEPGRYNIFPADEGITVVNRTRTASGRGSRGVTANFDEENHALELSGSVRRGGLEVATIPIPHPLNYIGQLLQNSIKEEHIAITGQVIVRTNPPVPGSDPIIVQRLGTHESPPLVQMLYLMMQQSNNFLAEQFWRAASARSMGCGDVPRARQAEIQWYRRHGLPTIEPGWDGSGLSRMDQFSARDLAAITRGIYNTAYQGIFLKVLPTAGQSGTLRHRSTSLMDGRVTAKTGTLAGVSSLTGFIRDEKGNPRYVFSAIGNARRDTSGRLATRINALMNVAIHRLDDEIASGKRPAVVPTPIPGADFDYAFSRATLASGSGDFFGAEAEAMGAEKESTTSTAHLLIENGLGQGR